jgi:pyruvate formate lyase activating enzyme
MGARTFALQQARDMGTPAGFCATRPGWDDQVRSLARDIDMLGFDRFIFRGDS